MDRNGDIRIDQSNQSQSLFRIHRDHQERKILGWDGRPAEMDEHEIDPFISVSLGNLFQFVDQKGITRDIDPISTLEFLLFFISIICL